MASSSTLPAEKNPESAVQRLQTRLTFSQHSLECFVCPT